MKKLIGFLLILSIIFLSVSCVTVVEDDDCVYTLSCTKHHHHHNSCYYYYPSPAFIVFDLVTDIIGIALN